ncbi:hypothetical protein PV677_33570 [Streptomyces sp. DE06-01C]|uniref:hypothetical protein n=1 Tax=Streptomyces TaxID=1883 RepID=UPI0029C17827|nr:hypothetical protein [Streptomyces sp. DE06-01C]MDX5525596.1 hypothetical protein [Streptomyces sp. DE06-01C]
MTSYATALDTHHQHKPTFHDDYVAGLVGAGDVHAVEWPDPQGRTWDGTETMCGLSTLGMEQQEHSNPTIWPQPKWTSKACDACSGAVPASHTE